MITGTCGHEVSAETGTIAIKDYAREGGRAVSYPVVCDDCLAFYKEDGVLLEDKQAERDWFDGKLKYCNSQIKCKKSLYKKEYNDNAFTDGYTYGVSKREGDLIWVWDDNSEEFCFTKSLAGPLPCFDEYFD